MAKDMNSEQDTWRAAKQGHHERNSFRSSEGGTSSQRLVQPHEEGSAAIYANEPRHYRSDFKISGNSDR